MLDLLELRVIPFESTLGRWKMKRTFIQREWDYRSLDTPVTESYISNQQMENHAVGRLRCSLTAGVDLCLMRITGLLHANTPVLKSRALLQDDQGHGGWAAAHALPCGLICGERPIHEIPTLHRLREHIAEPYRYTNVIPQAANQADSRVEVFRGRGLTAAFRQFANRLIAIVPGEGNKLDRNLLQAIYSQLFQDYADCFQAVVASRREQQIRGKSIGPDGHVLIDPESFAPSEAQYKEEAVRMAVRLQLKAMRDLEGMGYSRRLVDDVEARFHQACGGQHPA